MSVRARRPTLDTDAAVAVEMITSSVIKKEQSQQFNEMRIDIQNMSVRNKGEMQ